MKKLSNKCLGILLITSLLSISAAVVTSSLTKFTNPQVTADTRNYTISLSKDNGRITTSSSSDLLTNSTAKTTSSNHIEIAYYQVSSAYPYYGKMEAESSYFYNTDTSNLGNTIFPLTNIISIAVSWSGNASPTLYYGEEENPSTNETSLSNGITVNAISGYNFFAIRNLSSSVIKITSITIVYGCTTPTSGILSSINLSDTVSSYTVGDTYSSSNGLQVVATYNDGTYINLTSGYTLNTTGFTPSSPFTTSGIYSLNVSYNGKTSNSIDVVVNSITKTSMEKTYTDFYRNNIGKYNISPNSGTVRFLVIPVWFTNSYSYITSDVYKQNVLSDIRSAFFGTAVDTGWNSVKSFYETESEGRLTIEGTVSDWYSCGQNSLYFWSYDNVYDFSKTASDWYFNSNPSDSRSNYDADGDGYLDGVIMIYGCPESTEGLWAYHGWTESDSNISKPTSNSFTWASYDFMYNSSSASIRAGSSFACGCTTPFVELDTHMFIHETGHLFGLIDYYDYSKQCIPASGFSMQDNNTGGHDPYSVLANGWAKPYIPTSSCVITINDFQSSHDIILLSPSWNSFNSPFDEYLLLELYTPTGLNEMDSTYQYMERVQGPSDTGIRLWHVDGRLIYATSKDEFSPSKITTNPNIDSNKVDHAMYNTYYWISDDKTDDNKEDITDLGKDYANYNLLQLIRNNTTITYQPKTNITSSDLFKNGSSFDMATYGSQFVNSGKLNSDTYLGWSFSVSISGSGASATATITLTKN